MNLTLSSFSLSESKTKFISVPHIKLTDITEIPSLETEVIFLTPVTVRVADSNGSVTSFSISSGDASGYVVVLKDEEYLC